MIYSVVTSKHIVSSVRNLYCTEDFVPGLSGDDPHRLVWAVNHVHFLIQTLVAMDDALLT